MSIASTQFHSEPDSFLTTDDQGRDNQFYDSTTNNRITTTTAATDITDGCIHHDEDYNLNLFTPSMEEFRMHTSMYTPTNSPWNYPDQGNVQDQSHLPSLYCTPRSIVTIQSIESTIYNAPIAMKPNIWSNGYSLATTNQQRDTTNQEVQLQLEHDQLQRQLQLQLEAQQEQHQLQLQKQQQLDLFTQKYYRYASMSKLTTNHPRNQELEAISFHQVKSPTIEAATTFVPARYTQPPCLTFRTYSGSIFTVPSKSRFFVIKSYNIIDVNASFEHKIWTSTELGNKRLDKAFHELQSTNNPNLDGKIFLFFLVNSLGKFCGVSEMKSCIDYNKTSDIWCEQTRWKGIFPVEWLLIKDVPNKFFQHLKVPSNEFKPVTNSRDTQEIPFDIGISMLKIISSFRSNE